VRAWTKKEKSTKAAGGGYNYLGRNRLSLVLGKLADQHVSQHVACILAMAHVLIALSGLGAWTPQ
jgi:phosphopantetheinyl transferase